jgi:hypothetical protein
LSVSWEKVVPSWNFVISDWTDPVDEYVLEINPYAEFDTSSIGADGVTTTNEFILEGCEVSQ